MERFNLTARRLIQPWAIRTPWLVPSLSSRHEIPPMEAYRQIKKMLRHGMLVSAYDLHHEFMVRERPLPKTPVIFDSGGYELRDRRPRKKPPAWDEPMYVDEIRKVDLMTPSVIITFDPLESPTISEQIRAAKRISDLVPEAAIDILLKPAPGHGETLDVDDVQAHIAEVGAFEVLGVTEDELGATMFERCSNLVALRQALEAAKLETPIHVFGCLDPLPMTLYFLCGADVFDGLQWLRNVFVDAGAVRRQTASILDGKWKDRDIDRMQAWTRNLAHLEILGREFGEYCDTKDAATLRTVKPYLGKIRQVTDAVGVELGEGE